MRSLFLTLVFANCMLLGLSAPFAAALGYIWVDIVKPQDLAYSIIKGASLSLIAAVATFVLYAAIDRKKPPKFTFILALIGFFACWVTLTTALSLPTIQISGWQKWSWVFNVLIFAIFIPYIFRSRVQIEAMLLVIIFSAATIFFTAGVKTALGGGGYGVLATMGSGNVGLSESSTLAAVCAMLIPLILYARNHSLIMPRNLFSKLLFPGLVLLALLTVIGTNARTGLIAVVVLFGIYALRSKKKVLWLGVMVVIIVGYQAVDLSSTSWGSRMSTINTYKADSSALGRVAVWNWTLGFVKEHPMGGGFDAYKLNGIAGVTEDGISYYRPGIVNGKAFHSIYFEVLGEQGIIGIITYLSIILFTWIKLWRLKKSTVSNPELKWVSDLATSLGDAIVVFLVAGTFIGIAYQPYIFYLVALGVSLDQYVARYLDKSTS
jgi:putative inorganic carbon (HCO3(-)) transporter